MWALGAQADAPAHEVALRTAALPQHPRLASGALVDAGPGQLSAAAKVMAHTVQVGDTQVTEAPCPLLAGRRAEGGPGRPDRAVADRAGSVCGTLRGVTRTVSAGVTDSVTSFGIDEGVRSRADNSVKGRRSPRWSVMPAIGYGCTGNSAPTSPSRFVGNVQAGSHRPGARSVGVLHAMAERATTIIGVVPDR